MSDSEIRNKAVSAALYDVLQSFRKIEWSRYSPDLNSKFAMEDEHKHPHFTVWRWQNPDPDLNNLIVDAVNSYPGKVKWEIRSKKRQPSLGGQNWVIEPAEKQKAEIGILSHQDVSNLAQHISWYVMQKSSPNHRHKRKDIGARSKSPKIFHND